MQIHKIDLSLLLSLSKLKGHIQGCSEDMQEVYEGVEKSNKAEDAQLEQEIRQREG